MQKHWIWTPETGFNVTYANGKKTFQIGFQAKTTQIMIAPAETALVIIDMQNISFLGQSGDNNAVLGAEHTILNDVNVGIPLARKIGLQVIWINWGFEEGANTLLPRIDRIFAFDKNSSPTNEGISKDMGKVKLDNKTTIEAGKKMVMLDLGHARRAHFSD